MARQLIVPGRFNGPPDSGNGGYTAGLVAGHLAPDAAVEVTLRRPPPLDTPLDVVAGDHGLQVRRGGLLVATALPGEVTTTVPPVPYQEAVKVSRDYPGFTAHPFPTCYTCGPQRPDGLGLFPGRLPDARTAAPFTVPQDVTPATVWAALDCPGGWAVDIEARPYVLGRITVRVHRIPDPGTHCVVTGALREVEGRKAQVATTLWPADADQPAASAHATWVALAPGRP